MRNGANVNRQSNEGTVKLPAIDLSLIHISARLEGTDLGTAIAKVQSAMADLHLPPSIRVEYGGTYKEQQRSFRDLVLVLVLAIVLVFCVLLFEFGTFAAPIDVYKRQPSMCGSQRKVGYCANRTGFRGAGCTKFAYGESRTEMQRSTRNPGNSHARVLSCLLYTSGRGRHL